jgi:hypothetical protein
MLVRSLSFPQNDEPRLAITDSEGRNCGVLVVVNRFEPMYGSLCEHKAGFFAGERVDCAANPNAGRFDLPPDPLPHSSRPKT